MMRKNEIKVGTEAPPHTPLTMWSCVKKRIFGGMGVIAMYFVRCVVYIVCVYVVLSMYVYVVYGHVLIVW